MINVSHALICVVIFTNRSLKWDSGAQVLSHPPWPEYKEKKLEKHAPTQVTLEVHKPLAGLYCNRNPYGYALRALIISI